MGNNNSIMSYSQLQKKRLKRQWKKLKDKQVLLKSQSVALGQALVLIFIQGYLLCIMVGGICGVGQLGK